MKMTRVKIKHSNSGDKGVKLKLLEIMCSNQIAITGAIPIPDGFIAILLNDEKAEKVFKEYIKKRKNSLNKRISQPFSPQS